MATFHKHAPQPGEAPTGICECGCGQPVHKLSTYTSAPMRYWNGYPVPFLPGHRKKAQRSDTGVARPNRRNQPPPEKIPSGLCECGCGGQTEIADRTLSHLRYFVGHPKPFIKGHHARHSHLCNRGPDHPAWKGGRYTSAYGYIYVYKPEHPAANADGHVLEHRLVAEQMLGRFLEPYEVPHHVNSVRDDNRPENLVVLTKSEHGKVHSEALVKYAAEHPETYSEAGKKGGAARWHPEAS